MRPRLPSETALTACGLVLSVAFVGIALRNLDRGAVLAALAGARMWPWALLGLASYGLGHGVRGWRCSLLTGPEVQLDRLTATNVVVIGYAVNNLLPARLGELARAGVLAERTGLPVPQALTITLVERLADGVAVLLLFLGVAGTVPLPAWARAAADVASALFGLGLAGVLAAVVFPGPLLGVTARLVRVLPRGLQDSLLRLAAHGVQGLAALRDPGVALRVAGLSLLVWLLEAGLFLALLPAVSLEARLPVALFVMAATNLGILMPSSPGFVGPFHWFAMQSLVLVAGVDEARALGYAVLVHVVFFVPVTLWGLAALATYGVEVGRAVAAAHTARAADTVEVAGVSFELLGRGGRVAPARPPPPWLVAVVAALTENPDLELDPDLREQAVVACAATVQGQLDALPPVLGWLVAIGMLAFRGSAALMTGRPFQALASPRRQALVEWWAYGPVPPTRQLFKVLRATALLAYYEDPRVERALGAPPRSQGAA